MSRRDEIIARAQAEFQAAIDRFRALREEILRQQRDVLSSNSPAARTALEKFEAADADGFARYQQAVGDANDAVVDAEFKASSVRFAADEAASAGWNEAREKAERRRQAGIAKADREFDDAFKQAQKISGAAHDKAIKNARAKRDADLAGVEQTFVEDTDAAWRAFEAASSEAREHEVAAFDTARLKQAAAADAAATTHATAIEKANQALDKALAGDPLAASIRDAFRLRLADVEAAHEREKQDILDRMKADLAAATP